MTRAHVALASLGAMLLASRSAGASADASTRLVFLRDAAAATACPDETALRRAVEARLGYDPFLPWGGATIVVRFDRDGTGFAAKVEMVAGGSSRGARTLRSADPGCAGLVDATALAVSIALDTLRPPSPTTTTTPVDTPSPAPSSVEPAVPSAADAVSSQERTPAESGGRWRAVVGLDALVSNGSAPSVAAGLSAWGRLQTGHWSAGIEARADLPRASAELAGSVSTWLVAGGLAPCFHLGPAFGCAVGQLGLLHASGFNLPNPKSGSDLFAAVGPRIGVEVPVTSWASFRLRADVLVNLYRAPVELDSRTAWTAFPATCTLGGGLAVRFP